MSKKSTKPSFEIADDEWEKFEVWAATKPVSHAAMGEQFTFSFMPTGLGMITSVTCGITNEKLVLTDFSNW